MRLLLTLVLFALACYERKEEPNQGSNAISQSAGADSRVGSGNYVGSFTDDDADHGVYLRLRDSSSALYDGLRWIRICQLSNKDSRVSFQTARMFNRAFAFQGTAQNSGLRGTLTGFADSLNLVFRRLDAPAESTGRNRDKSGFYSNLKYIEEAGDNVGQELLVGTVAGQTIVAFMMAEGTVRFPEIGFNIRESGDTLQFDIARDPTAPRVTAVFRDSVVIAALGNEEDLLRMPKVFSLSAFYDQSAEGVCTP